MAVGDVIAVEIKDKAVAVIDGWRHVFVAEERLEADIAAGSGAVRVRLIVKDIGSGVRGTTAERTALRAVDGDAFEVGSGQGRIAGALGKLGRRVPEHGCEVAGWAAVAFSNSMSAIEKAPTSQPARVK